VKDSEIMDKFCCYLAQSAQSTGLPLRRTRLPDMVLNPETKVILTVCGAVALALFLWAVFIRQRRHPDPHVRTLEEGLAPSTAHSNKQHSHRGHGRRRRHRRSEHRHRDHRNPTLQEAGGLPPLRPENEAPKE
jgi:hypothetical protein